MYDPVFLYYYCEEIDDNFPSPNNMELEKRNNNIVVEIMAGDGLQKGAKHYGVCTAGFVAITKKKNITCIATAGHCYLNDNYYLHPWNSRPTGYIIGQMDVAFEHKIDFGLIPIVGNVKPVPSIRNTDSRKYRELLIDDIITVSHYGVHLCVSGYFSHVKCGHVKALSGFISLPKGFHENLFFVGLTCRYGDSGAPFFSYKQDLKRVSLNGILAGGLTNIIGDKVYGDIMGVITIDSILNTLRKDGRKIIVVTAK
ncbi:hypothetical protein F8M41_023514 [Gigaspora margarita]|uniref:Serine protease n=1 Tax=Gigaspora margarita TaxID=4874 RepID=A0A8H4AD77_GIGMA|nr:hypothetical protein F8M41_023514 [Gigaspora margarita]